MDEEVWLHGTEVYFEEWKLPLGKQPHKGGMESHTAIFFTTSREYALGAANGSGGICSAKLLSSSKILDMNNCSSTESEQYRSQVSKKYIGRRNPQVIYPQFWKEGWRSGRIMKYAASTPQEATVMQQKANLAIHAKHTPQGAAAHNELQLLTRNVIEELVVSARELDYEAVIGNEIDTLHPLGPKTYRIMFALNTRVITDPEWVAKPKKANN